MRKFTLILVALLVITGLAFSQFTKPVWVPVDGTSVKPMPIQVKVLSQSAKEIKLELRVPGYFEGKIQVEDKECLGIYMPQAARIMERGFPELPLFTKPVQVREDCGEMTLKVIEQEFVEFKLKAPVMPSKGHFTRDIPESAVRYEFGSIYQEDVFWPKEVFKLGEHFMMRDMSGTCLKVLPISVNHVQMKMNVLKRAVITISCQGKVMVMGAGRKAKVKPNKTFHKMYRDFAGYEESVATASSTREGEEATLPPESNKKLVVVVPSQFETLIGEWVAWKKQNGYVVTVKTITSSDTASTIKSYLQGLYNDVNTRFGYVVLFGDAAYNSNFEVAQPMPSFKGSYESAASDRVYVRLAGSDNYPDAFISRISGDASTIPPQLTKIMNYEKGVSGAWLNQAILIASDQGSPTDKERTGWLKLGGGTSQKVPVVAGGLKGYGYTSFAEIYDPSASASAVTSAVNNGASIICYIGHGSSTSLGTTGFSVSGVNALTNGSMVPVIFSVACVNGDFLKTGTCFAEAWLRKANGGAVAFEGASTNEAWVPPCDKQAASINAIINKTHSTFGAVEMVGVYAGLQHWGDTNSGQGNQMAEQCNLFGDCTTLLRTKQPTAIQLTSSRGLDNNIIFNVTSEDRAVAEATVTIYSEDFAVQVTGDTDETGAVNLTLPSYEGTLYYTVVGQDLTPIVHQPLE